MGHVVEPAVVALLLVDVPLPVEVLVVLVLVERSPASEEVEMSFQRNVNLKQQKSDFLNSLCLNPSVSRSNITADTTTKHQKIILRNSPIFYHKYFT